MIVVADSNEQSTNPSIVALMKKRFPKMTVTSLSFGDYNIILDNGDILAVERKNVGDFLGSVGDGRVFRQVEAMCAARFSCIVMVGSMYYDGNDMVVADRRLTGWNGKAIRAALTAIQFSGCPIVWCDSDGYFPDAVQEMVEFCSRPAEHLQRLSRKRIVTFPPVEVDIEILASFPGVGIKRAQALMDFVANTDYSSLAGALAWASAFPLIKEGGRPEGWGNKTVLNFRGLLGLGNGQYLEIKEEEKNGRKGKNR